MLTCNFGGKSQALALKDFETTAGLVAAQRAGRGNVCSNYVAGSCREGVGCGQLHPHWHHVQRNRWSDGGGGSQHTAPSGAPPRLVQVLVRRTNTTYAISADDFHQTEHLSVAVRMQSGTACSHHLRETCLNGASCRFLHPKDSALLTTLRSEISPENPALERAKQRGPEAAPPTAAESPQASPTVRKPAWGLPTGSPTGQHPQSGRSTYRSDGTVTLDVDGKQYPGLAHADFEMTADVAVITRSGTAKACRDHLNGSCPFGTMCQHAHPTSYVMRTKLVEHLGERRRINLGIDPNPNAVSASKPQGAAAAAPAPAAAPAAPAKAQSKDAEQPLTGLSTYGASPAKPTQEPSDGHRFLWGALGDIGGTPGRAPANTSFDVPPTPHNTPMVSGSAHKDPIGMGRRRTTEDEDEALLDLVHIRGDDTGPGSAAKVSKDLEEQVRAASTRVDDVNNASTSVFRVEEVRTPSTGVSPALRGSTISGGVFSNSLTRATPPVEAAAAGKLPSPMLRPTAFTPDAHDTSGGGPGGPLEGTGTVAPGYDDRDPWAPTHFEGNEHQAGYGMGHPDHGGYGPDGAYYPTQGGGYAWPGNAPPPYDGPGGAASHVGPIAVTAESKEVYHIDKNDFEMTRNLAATVRIGSGIACSHHLRDRCNNGASCRFLHPVERVLATVLRSELGRNHPVLRGGSVTRPRFSGSQQTTPTIEPSELPVPKSRQSTDAAAEAAAKAIAMDAPSLAGDSGAPAPKGPTGAWAARNRPQTESPGAALDSANSTPASKPAIPGYFGRGPQGESPPQPPGKLSWASRSGLGGSRSTPGTSPDVGPQPPPKTLAVPKPKSQQMKLPPALGAGASAAAPAPKPAGASGAPKPAQATTAWSAPDQGSKQPASADAPAAAPKGQVKGRSILESLAALSTLPAEPRNVAEASAGMPPKMAVRAQPSNGIRCGHCADASLRRTATLGCEHVLCCECLTKVARANAKKRVPCPCCGKFVADVQFASVPGPFSFTCERCSWSTSRRNEALAHACKAADLPAKPQPASQPQPERKATAKSEPARPAPKPDAKPAAAPKPPTPGKDASRTGSTPSRSPATTSPPPTGAPAPTTPPKARARPEDAKQLAAAGKLAEAIEAWTSIIDQGKKLAPTAAAELLASRGALHLQTGNADEARADADRGLKLAAGHVDCLMVRAKALHAQGKHGQAISALQKVLGQDKTHAEASSLLPQVKAEKDAKAQAEAEALVAESGDDAAATASDTGSTSKRQHASPPVAKRPVEKLKQWVEASAAAATRKEYGQCVENLSNAVDLFNHLTREGRCQLLVRRAIAYYRLKKPAKAKQDARRAHDLNSVCATPWPIIAELLKLLKDDYAQRGPKDAPSSGVSPTTEAAPANLDAQLEETVAVPPANMPQLIRPSPASGMVEMIWSDDDDDEAVFDAMFSMTPAVTQGIGLSMPNSAEITCNCPACRARGTLQGPADPSPEAAVLEMDLFSTFDGSQPMSHGLKDELEMLAAKAAPSVPRLEHLYRLISLSCLVTGAFVDVPPNRRVLTALPHESASTAAARFRAFFKAGVRGGHIPKWLNFEPARDMHEKVCQRIQSLAYYTSGGPLGVHLFAPCYLYFAALVTNDLSLTHNVGGGFNACTAWPSPAADVREKHA